MTATITVDFSASAEAFARVEALAAETVLRNVNWNGATLRVERGEFTCIDGADEIAGAALLNDVYRAIDGE